MIVLGIILALIGWLASISILLWLGIVLLILGIIFNLGGFVRAPYGSGRYWY
jgi:hypothetical protein